MQDLILKFNTLKANEKILLVFASLLLLFVFSKLLIIDKQQEKLKNLQNRAALIKQQQDLLAVSAATNNSAQARPSNELISDFLRQHNSNDKLKNIRATQAGEQRYELDNIQFNVFLDLLVALEKNGSQHSMLQLKENKVNGTVNAVLVSQ